ncbi:hypothetical protein [Nocardia sp. NPDC052566]|uniref:hypothetical protein n=1 Tax=Nocardia sp. NPDC052566 TaxID=3364330 RepID=UPI0037C95D9A
MPDSDPNAARPGPGHEAPVAAARPDSSSAPSHGDTDDGARTPVSGSLTPEVAAVVQRWNPQGMALLRAMSGNGAGSVVLLFGPDDANTTLLRTELARFEPHIDLSEPRTDAEALVESTVPGAASGIASSGMALVLLDAGSTLGADTMHLLHRLRADDARILLAMNGIHAHRDWRAVRERDLALLAGHGITDLDIIPVSGRLAVAARTSGDAGLLDRSGIGGLHAMLAAATTDTGGADRLAAVTARVLADTRGRIREQIAALRSGAEVARLREERATLLAGRDGGRTTAMSALRGQLHLARVDLMTDVGTRIRAAHTTARGELDRLRRREFGGYPERLQLLVNELTGELDTAIDHRLAELAERMAPADAVVRRRRDLAPRVGPDPEPRHRGVEDHLMIALGASAGVGLGRLLVAPFELVAELDVASVPVTLLLGAGAAGWVVRTRGQLADRNHVRQWVADTLVNVKAQLEQRIATALVETETVLSERVVAASTARVVESDRRVAELEAGLRRLAAEQPAQLAACERDIECVDRWIANVG